MALQRVTLSDKADQIIGLYERRAHEWDEVRSRGLFERAWLDRFIALLPAGGSVLDIGCGSGEPIARYLIDRGLSATGVDSSSAMIGMCQARFPEQTWCVADMRTLGLGRTYDGVLAWDSFFHLRPEDQRPMFAVFAAHAVPGAALMFTSGTSFGEAIGTFHGEALYHGSLDTAEYRALLEAQGFQVVAHVVEDPHCGGRTIWLAQRL
jgi:trans-aconitate methyltransferase